MDTFSSAANETGPPRRVPVLFVSRVRSRAARPRLHARPPSARALLERPPAPVAVPASPDSRMIRGHHRRATGTHGIIILYRHVARTSSDHVVRLYVGLADGGGGAVDGVTLKTLRPAT